MNNLQPKDIDEVFTFYRNENNGKEPTEWEQVIMFNNQGFGIISVDGYFGTISRNGEIVIPLEYSNLIDFDDELILACNVNDFWGLINWKNEIIIPFEYSYASIFLEKYNLSKVCKNGKYGYIDRRNQEVIPLDYDSITIINFNEIGVLRDGKWGIVNVQNQLIIDFKYDFAICIAENIYYVGKEVAEKIENYDLDLDLLTFKNGNLVKFGLIDENENLLMEYESYTTTGFFANNKVLAFDYHRNENYLFDIISKERMYAPTEINEDEKTDYLKNILLTK
ncbi:WG repeat-containing protein [Epilithonimonas hominis]|nr:WG repeat-containing protein [Epilithonimonas hominis]